VISCELQLRSIFHSGGTAVLNAPSTAAPPSSSVPMRIFAMVLGLILLLAAGSRPAGSVGGTGMHVQLDAIPVAAPVNPDPRVGPLFLLGIRCTTAQAPSCIRLRAT
jgi:hypothetical protein